MDQFEIAFLQEILPRLKRMKVAFLHDYGCDREIVEEFNLRWNSLAFALADLLVGGLGASASQVSHFALKAVYEARDLEEYFIHYLTE